MIKTATIDDARQYLLSRGIDCPDLLSVNAVVVDDCLFVAWGDTGAESCEVHACTIKNKIRGVYNAASEAFEMLRDSGYITALTTVDKHLNVQNKFCSKLGFELVGCYNNLNLYRRYL